MSNKQPFQVYLTMDNGVHGRLHISEVEDALAAAAATPAKVAKKGKQAAAAAMTAAAPAVTFASLQVGQTLSVKVIGYHDTKTHKFLPISHRQSVHT